MKIKTFKSKQILALYLLKSKTYEQTIKKNTSSILRMSYFTEILVNFKKLLQIIFQYHIKNKLILFIGLPENLSSKINKFTPHIALFKYDNLQGCISGISKNKEILSELRNTALLKKGKKPFLIVLIGHEKMDFIIKESYLYKIPLICVNTGYDSKTFFYRSTYQLVIKKNLLDSLSNFWNVGLSFLFKSPKPIKFLNKLRHDR